MTPDERDALLAPFPPEAIGKLPRVTCKACTEANKKQWGTTCDRHSKVNCPVCGNWISEKHIHLDYVGHAATTKRLIDVDPEWTWEPVATDTNGAPLVSNGGLWIRLTVCGVTRLGWGDGADFKVMIGDAIRNAAMRFGVALDLWSKEDLRRDENAASGGNAGGSTGSGDSGKSARNGPTDQTEASTREPSAISPSPPVVEGGSASTAPTREAEPTFANKRAQLKARCVDLGTGQKQAISEEREKWSLPKIDDCDEKQLQLWSEMLDEITARLEAPFTEPANA